MNKFINCTVEDENVILPKYQSKYASGMDLHAWKWSNYWCPEKIWDFPEEGINLKPSDRILIRTGLHIELPVNIEAQIRPRSGLALKNGISIVNTPGTIDSDYRGDVGVILINHGKNDFVIKKGDRIAQLVFQKVERFNLNVVKKLSETARGEGGFNSTGI